MNFINFLTLKLLSISTALAEVGGKDSSSGTTIKIENPLGAGATIETLLNKIIDFLAFKLGPIIATGFIVYAAFLIITSGGDERKFKSGITTLRYTLIGYVILIISKGLVLVIKELLGVAS
ncbi:MAG: hypothetical protein WC435_02200 [Candidatus Paceibacterota bacterium]